MADGDDSNLDTFSGQILVGGKWGCESLAGGCMGECVGQKSMLRYFFWGILEQWSICAGHVKVFPARYRLDPPPPTLGSGSMFRTSLK